MRRPDRKVARQTVYTLQLHNTEATEGTLATAKRFGVAGEITELKGIWKRTRETGDCTPSAFSNLPLKEPSSPCPRCSPYCKPLTACLSGKMNSRKKAQETQKERNVSFAPFVLFAAVSPWVAGEARVVSSVSGFHATPGSTRRRPHGHVTALLFLLLASEASPNMIVPLKAPKTAKRVEWPDVEARAKRIFGSRVLPNLVLLEREEAAP